MAIQYCRPYLNETCTGLHCALGETGSFKGNVGPQRLVIYMLSDTHRCLMNFAYITATPT